VERERELGQTVLHIHGIGGILDMRRLCTVMSG
jgi:hypothetical protein